MSRLEKIGSPADVKKLNTAELYALAGEIRQKLIQVVSQNGGHLASNLGAVELTLALHKTFTTPKDAIVWDVGHQCYTHKMLTGRLSRIDTIRTEGGLSGFPKPYESEHDAFVAGHASTSISAALGLSEAKRLQGDEGYVVAVIGDGALTGGMAYEALNNSGKTPGNLIVILNDNEMSISKSVGSVANYLSDIRTKPAYYRFKDRLSNTLEHTPVVGKQVKEVLQNSKSRLKTMIYHTTFFEDWGFDYLGPIDGHDIDKLCAAMERAKRLARPVVIHVATQKGKGYSKAEENPGAYHGVPSFDLEKGNPDISLENSFSSAFGKSLVKLALKDSRICAITAAMKYATGLQFFKHKYPNRFYDVGIAEQHAVTFASGLATGGLLPVFAVYSTFLQRSFDQILHDTALQGAHVVFAIDRAGLVGQDGETHQGIYDVSLLTQVPGMQIFSPVNYRELSQCLRHCIYEIEGPCALRYPRGKEDESLPVSDTDLKKGYQLQKCGSNRLVVTYGRVFSQVLAATAEQPADILRLCRIWPVSDEMLDMMQQYDHLYLVEEGIRAGGVAATIAAALMERGYRGEVRIRAIDNGIVPQAAVERNFCQLGLDAASLTDFLRQ